ncbi:hypothetical protein [Vibrio porteresiae]|nr:hypothetical protein [Vibrio porteresiae]
MLHSLLAMLPPMLLGAQLVLTLIMVKGEICPGQRGRVHKVLPVVGILWLATAFNHLIFIVLGAGILFFCSQVQTKKTRDEGPLWAMHVTNVLAVLALLWQSFLYPHLWAGVAHFISLAVSGSVLAHLLMTLARSRLQAFNRILPVVGIVGTMLMVLCLVPYGYQLSESALGALTQGVLTYLALLVLAIITWCWHIFTNKSVAKIQLAVTQILILIAMTGFEGLYLL